MVGVLCWLVLRDGYPLLECGNKVPVNSRNNRGNTMTLARVAQKRFLSVESLFGAIVPKAQSATKWFAGVSGASVQISMTV
jgi:hypothetical protein